ncbi:hemin uptake protein HemP [Amylibacter sp. SFDW26]|uniref:hemin uptake protein HemP n=1 Tax=Amylibacter sp. SFDW26 TaxID=2652722 RepID=UPI00126203E0|nr:hemin uptake protein HemP [Amylibacter sp. SFDW26]KAB7614454.1 hemin uptake protein HemP [Amylibacter sp. SFDW26]
MSLIQNVNIQDAQQVASIPEHDALALTQKGTLAKIHLDEKIYTLRITRQGKLILTK